MGSEERREELLKSLSDCVVNFEEDEIKGVAQTVLDEGFNAYDAVMNGLAAGMEIVLEDINFIASFGSGELSEDEKRMFKASMNVNVDNIRQKSFDEDTNIYTCAADLTVRSSAGIESNSITYTSTLQNGEAQVTISGLN